MSSQQLISYWKAVKQNDKAAFDSLYLATIDAVYTYALSFTKDEAIIDDTIQEVYADFWVSRHKINITSSFKGYFLKTFRRRLLKQLQIARKNTTVFEADKYFTKSHESALIQKEFKTSQKNKLQKAIATLSPRQKEAIYLKYYLQMEYTDISETMQIQENGAYKLISNALSRLRNHF